MWYQHLAFCMQAENNTSESFLQRIEVSKNIFDILLKGLWTCTKALVCTSKPCMCGLSLISWIKLRLAQLQKSYCTSAQRIQNESQMTLIVHGVGSCSCINCMSGFDTAHQCHLANFTCMQCKALTWIELEWWYLQGLTAAEGCLSELCVLEMQCSYKKKY